ncbi:hypothetical protein CANCADRAFT_65801 [Tortispora caseinolytica NRRL Y-17796]|uniref:Putative mitochondrial carrier protein PET8 n=1 Tax=Tortispora caseinolytica NRRL Y-17796 TaxID=767744 RepID=A0A1E4TBW5_9ASCO|nr:hypothetical protein CANCADRAFT_65801 [Tortispora caseinolytica NRRL Y-17796]
MEQHAMAIPMISGGLAGTVTDLVFFPVDTIKTRLQAKEGFLANGGWRGMYRGIGSTIVASAPGASLFFVTYESMNAYLYPLLKSHIASDEGARGVTHMLAASLGEIAACSVRVPSEVVKQRAQANKFKSSKEALLYILKDQSGEGIRRGLYRGWTSTIIREIPFTAIQFPVYEWLKRKVASYYNAAQPPVLLGAACGSAAGALAAACTTPLDVIKTRLMLSESRDSLLHITASIWKQEGPLAFLRGLGPRVMWISAGGAIFLGVYDYAKRTLTSFVQTKSE